MQSLMWDKKVHRIKILSMRAGDENDENSLLVIFSGYTVILLLNVAVSQLIGAVVGPLSVLLLVIIMGLISLCAYCYRRYQSKKG